MIANNDETHIITSGTSALAKAGTGDVLAGMIAGLLAQGLDPLGAALLGVELHAQAGIVASQKVGPISVCAEDVLWAIPGAIGVLTAHAHAQNWAEDT